MFIIFCIKLIDQFKLIIRGFLLVLRNSLSDTQITKIFFLGSQEDISSYYLKYKVLCSNDYSLCLRKHAA